MRSLAEARAAGIATRGRHDLPLTGPGLVIDAIRSVEEPTNGAARRP